MTALVSLLATIVLTLLAIWTLGSHTLRILGGLLVIAALSEFALSAAWPFAGAITLVLGIAAWLTGHLLYAYRHRTYATPLAERVIRTLCRALRQPDPTRR